ncbi:hypothetical protein GCM10009742_34960 [Kribbella karoonensis]|uniref:Uncharacterized protein n=1 Tax=Kribbella karoonensis TaxID=324851 RepID=A0ABN2DVP4_9ACTN
MPEKVRVSPAPAVQLSTGSGQAALVPEEDEPLDDEPDDAADEDPDVPDELAEPDDDESDALELPEEDESDFAGTEPLPEDRLSVR